MMNSYSSGTPSRIEVLGDHLYYKVHEIASKKMKHKLQIERVTGMLLELEAEKVTFFFQLYSPCFCCLKHPL